MLEDPLIGRRLLGFPFKHINRQEFTILRVPYFPRNLYEARPASICHCHLNKCSLAQNLSPISKFFFAKNRLNEYLPVLAFNELCINLRQD